MKTILFILALFLIVSVSNSQLIRVDIPVFVGAVTANSAGDSVSNLPIAYGSNSENSYPNLVGQMPDSVWVLCSATDSVFSKLRFGGMGNNGTYQMDTLADFSNVSGAGKTTRTVPAVGTYQIYGNARLAYIKRATNNGTGSTVNKFWITYVRWFHK